MSVSKREMLDKLDTAFELMLDPTFSGEKILREWRMAHNAIRALIEQGPEVDEDWLIAKANAVLYALRHRFLSRIKADDTVMMRDLLADVVMAAGVKVKEG